MENWSGTGITPERWKRVKGIFESALELAAEKRAMYLSEQCTDEALRAEVNRLLENHDRAGDFLVEPAIAGAISLPETPSFPEGALLAGRFRILKFIARGGMGEVYEAEDLELHERVAIKTIRPEILREPNAITRFKREVHLARKVTHPGVCRIFDMFRDRREGLDSGEETVFISMELLEGKTLAEYLRDVGRLSQAEALPLIKQMAAALGAAHAVGVVHRDFKPGNVVLARTVGQDAVRPVVTDFGLASQSVFSEDSVSLFTGQGILGTPAYMAPEQLEGRPATAASDIYSLGLLIYEMVTGERPFLGDTAVSAALKRLSEAPTPPRRRQPGVTPAWEAAILRCLERDPQKRFGSTEDVTGALETESRASADRGRNRASTKTLVEALGRYPRWIVAVAAILLTGIAAGGWLLHPRKAHALTEKDSLVVADFTNTTGDPIFDDTLKTALTISLRQSPFLNVLPDGEVAKTLQLMTLPPETKLTPGVARELCQRAASKGYLVGSISSLGSEYVLGLKAVGCQTGNTLAEEQMTAESKEKVLDVLGRAATKLRAELGESLGSLQKFNVPLVQATTSSLEALKAYTVGEMLFREKGSDAALPYHQRAINLDPTFAMAYLEVGNHYAGLGEVGRAGEYFTKAYQLRAHASEWERLVITADYYENVTGELENAAETFEEEIQNYPRNSAAHVDLGNIYAMQGEYEKALEVTRQAQQLDADYLAGYVNVPNYLLALQRFDEAGKSIRSVQSRKLDSFLLHVAQYGRAFLQGDTAGLTAEEQWFRGKPEENFGYSLASDTEAYSGHLQRARELTQRAVSSSIRADSKETGAIWFENAAIREAAFGNKTEAQKDAATALKLAPASQGVQLEAALALAMAGETARAEILAQDLEKRFPLDTQIQSLWLPTIHAQLALGRKEPLDRLQTTSSIHLGQILFVSNISCLYPSYVHGEEYLASRQGSAAAGEFQKILEHSGIVWNCWTGALAHLGLARAYALEGESAKSRSAYQDFLTLWKDADADIPILKQAKTEYAKLR